MLKYRGQYRICFETDNNGRSYEFTFIPCHIKKGSSICRHNEDTLNCYITSTKITHRLLKEYPNLFRPFQVGDREGILLFRESDIGEVAVILKARVMGKNKSPRPKRQVTISEERKRELSERMKQLNNKKFIGENARKTG